MKKLILILLAVVIGLILIGCSHTAYIREHPDLLKPGLHASAFLEAWGQPDETMSYLDYQNKQYSSVSGGSSSWNANWNARGGNAGGSGGYHSYDMTYTPPMVVWTYYRQGKILLFSRDRINTGNWLVGGVIPLYRSFELVGWQSIPKQASPKQDVPEAKSQSEREEAVVKREAEVTKRETEATKRERGEQEEYYMTFNTPWGDTTQYHRIGCPYGPKTSQTGVKLSKEQVKAKRLKPCPICKP